MKKHNLLAALLAFLLAVAFSACGQTALNTAADPTQIQVLYLWEQDNVPAKTNFTAAMTGYFDNWDFRPYVTAIPVRAGVQPKGAVVLMAGGAYQFRGNYTDSLPTAAALRELGFQTLIVDYCLSPYTQEEGALDVAAMQDSFPHALELSKRGYNAFALIYRPGAQTACEDLARAIAFLYDHAEELQIDMDGYSLWGGSAGARMAAWLGSYGTAAFGEREYPRPGAVIMQYTGLGEVYGNEPPTYNCVGTADGIANYRTMQRRIAAIQAQGTPARIDIYPGLAHGFGLGEGTVAEGWLDNAVTFWQENI